MEFPYISKEFDKSKPKDSVIQLLSDVFPPKKGFWDPQVKAVTEGTTNGLFKVTQYQANRASSAPTGDPSTDAFLVKIYGEGTETTIDRDKEISFHSTLSKNDLAPSLLARFPNGHAYQFLPGKPCSVTDITEERVWRGVARELARWHAILPVAEFDFGSNSDNKAGKIKTILTHKPNVWSTAERWLKAIPESTSQAIFKTGLLSDEFEYLIEKLRPDIGAANQSFVFGHGDLLSGNIIIQGPAKDPAGHVIESVKFIDYEHSTYCPRAFDLANHFSEWTGFECDYNLLPTTSTRHDFLREYLRSYHSIKNQPGTQVDTIEVFEEKVSKLSSEVDSYRGFPGFYWGLCALIQAQASTGSIDFDYAGYARLRFAEYRAWREEEDGTRDAKEDMPLREKRWAAA
ncbi:hypothetical protein TWF481_007487 [Arthrobotrys musiformis]|uniref:ethanolamine kinase n=1 Tax=Arthrobotrys musiformis TaxID=47236 RepID=A0AAV9WBL9_9PEZI